MINYKIKQLKENHDDYAFEWWDWAKERFTLADYDVIYEGEIEDENKPDTYYLEMLFTKFNIARPEDFKGHSLSVSDVVELNGVNYYCDSAGWVKVEE